MSTPTPQPSNPPNAQPPHAANQPETPPQNRPPVVVQTSDNSDTTNRLSSLEQTIRGLPEAIVNSFREATQPAVEPQTPPPVGNAGGSGAQAPGSNNIPPNPPDTMEKQVTGGTAAKPGRFASWWFKR